MIAKFFHLTLLILGLTLLAFAIRSWHSNHIMLKEGRRSVAEVVKLIPKRSDDKVLYTPLLEYQNQSGTKEQFQGSISSSPPQYRIGDKVPIVFTETDDAAIISYWNIYVGTIILFSFALPMIVIGGGYVLFYYQF